MRVHLGSDKPSQRLMRASRDGLLAGKDKSGQEESNRGHTGASMSRFQREENEKGLGDVTRGLKLVSCSRDTLEQREKGQRSAGSSHGN